MLNEKQKKELDGFVERLTDRVDNWADHDDLYYRAGLMACDWIEKDGVQEFTESVPEELSQQAIGYIDGKYCDPSFHSLTKDEAEAAYYDNLRKE